MAGITERNKQKNELTSIGFSMRYIDEWQPKTTLYRHTPSYTVSGEMDSDVGTAVKGVPGSPDYVLRKARMGLFPWLPGESCTCKWCAERNTTRLPHGESEDPEDSGADRTEGVLSAPLSKGKSMRKTGADYSSS